MALTGPAFYGNKYLEGIASTPQVGGLYGWLIDDNDNSISKISGNQVLEKYLPGDPEYNNVVRANIDSAARGTFEEYLSTYFPGGTLRQDLQAPKAPLTQAQVDAENAAYDRYVASNTQNNGVEAARYTDEQLRQMRDSGQLVEGGTRNTIGGFTPGSISGGSTGGTLGSGGGSSGGVQFQPTGNPILDETLNSLNQYLAELEARGQVLNPNIKLDEATLAKFTKQAEAEINPYYSTQLKLARESLLTSAGYSKSEILRQEQDLERQYKTAFRGIGESAADQGFALSGLRQRDEGELAGATNRAIETGRRNLAFDTANAARGFAQLYGGKDVPNMTIEDAPSVGSGELGFNRGGTQRSLYTLDPSIYDSLVGSQEFEQRGAVRNRASELESAFRSNQALDQQRKLVL